MWQKKDVKFLVEISAWKLEKLLFHCLSLSLINPFDKEVEVHMGCS